MLKFGWFHHSSTQDFNGTIDCDPILRQFFSGVRSECHLRNGARMTGVAKDELDQMRSSLARDPIDLSSRFGMAAFAAMVRRTSERAACLDDQ